MGGVLAGPRGEGVLAERAVWHGRAVQTSSWLTFLVALGVLAVATGFGLWWRSRQGRPRPAVDQQAPADPATAELLASLGVTGDRVTLLQFSSAFCAPCRATRVICGQFADRHDDVAHVEVDAESQLSAVRALGVWRTPTLFVVDHTGRLVSRITGAPTRSQLVEAVAPLLPEQVRP
ncbi:thioredoxin family protein [Natronosporangium hydrolyticum]|uniref:Thioredoxin family protein n=1 Tax=Natronosporangium hydrolyticum TaxID=2811111 RepID=A0A895YEE0_9ACTN|nr:thioredoxin family protein [Natronosporangium hydrolyticum]QSB16214.1 thioredoxin family protein [Natronosporangium hydrolyticum]